MSRPISNEKAPTEAQMQYIHDLQVALNGAVQAEAKVAEAKSKLPVASAAEAGKRYRGYLSLLDGYNRAKLAGTGAAKIRAFSDIVVDRNETPGIDESLLKDIRNDTKAANPEALEGSPQWNRVAWAQYVKRAGALPGFDKHLLPNVRMMEEDFGTLDEAIKSAASDSDTRAGLEKIKQVYEMNKAAEAVYNARTDLILQAKGLTQGGKDPSPAEVDTFLKSMSAVDSAAGVATADKFVKDNVNKADELVGSMKDEYDSLTKTQEELAAYRKDLLAKTSPESERDEVARVLSRPKYQEWAKANGFDVGYVMPADPNKTYNAGELTTSGVYVPGPDDRKALQFALHQDDRYGKSQPFLHNDVTTTPMHGRVTVYVGGHTPHPDGQYHYTVNEGQRVYHTAEEEQAMLTGGVPPEEFHKTAEVPAGQATEVIRGTLEAPYLRDPAGSVRISGRLYTKEQLAEPPHVTSGGEDKPLKKFLTEYKQRRDANVQTRQENAILNEKEPFNAASWLAQTLTPAVKSVQEAKTDEELARAAEMLRRRQEEAAQIVSDMTGRDKADVMQEIRAGKEYNAYVETNREQLDVEGSEKAKILMKMAAEERAQRLGTGAITTPIDQAELNEDTPSSFIPTSQFVRQPETMVPQTPAPAPSKADQRAALYNAGKNAKGGDLLYQTNAPAPRGLAGDTMPTKFDREDTAPKAAPGPKPTTPYEDQGLQASRARLPAAKVEATPGTIQGEEAVLRTTADQLRVKDAQRPQLIVPTVKDVYATRGTRSKEDQREAYIQAVTTRRMLGKDPYADAGLLE